MLSLFQTTLVVKQRNGGVSFSDLPCLASGKNLKPTSNKLEDIRRQGITVDNENNPDLQNIIDEAPQSMNAFNWEPDVIICPGHLNSLHHTYVDFKNYSHKEVTKIKKLELF